MTDKEKLDKLIAEIERRITFFKKQSVRKTTTDDNSCALALQGVLCFYDSMQKEPATSLWHDASETPVASKDKVVLYTNGKWDLFKAYESLDDYDNYWSSVNQSLAEKGIFVKQWAYTADLIKL